MTTFDHSTRIPRGAALALSLLAFAVFCGAATALAEPATPAPWVARSNANAQVLLDVLAKLAPESAGQLGVNGLDEQIFDLSPGYNARANAALRQAAATLRQRLAGEKDPAVAQDLEILIRTAEQNVEGNELNERLQVPYFNVTQAIFGGLRTLLDDQVAAERRPAALVRLKRYSGLDGGYQPLATLAEQDVRSKLTQPGLIGPFKGQVERDLNDNATYRDGIGKLFAKYKIAGYEEPYHKLLDQLTAYDDFVRREVLPKAAADFRLPPELYAFSLKQFGVDMPVEELVSRAQTSFREIQNQMQVIAPLVAKERGLTSTDYRDVLRELKKEQLEGDAILAHYQARIAQIEEIIRREGIVTLPDRPMKVRLASEAESAAVPAPNMRPPRLLGNTGEMGELVLPLHIQSASGQGDLKLDDFTYKAASWTLTAHEGRPGHELQFSRLVEKGVSIARAIFAFNSVNVEGWALYAEAEMQPYEPFDGQLVALQARLQRAARAFLDPGLQMGTISRDEAFHVLEDEVGLSKGMALQEVERYTFRAPGQAVSYFCGYSRLMELRTLAERKLGDKFNRQRYHDFILAQGLLPPELLRKAVLEDFVPHELAETGAAKSGAS